MSLAFLSVDDQKRSSLKAAIAKVGIGLLMVVVSLGWAIPGDTFTSALFMDGLGLQPVFTQLSPLFGPSGIWRNTPAVSYEGTGFALALIAMSLYTGWMASSAGQYAARVKWFHQLVWALVTRQEVRNINHRKIVLVLGYWALMSFDTFTDTDYRAFFGAGGLSLYLKSFMVSFFYYAICSEFMVMAGLNTLWNGVGDLRLAIAGIQQQPPQQRQQGERNRSQQRQTTTGSRRRTQQRNTRVRERPPEPTQATTSASQAQMQEAQQYLQELQR